MKRSNDHRIGLVRTVGVVLALLCVAVSGLSGMPAGARIDPVHPVAMRTDGHRGHHEDTDGHPDKSEPTRSGLPRTGPDSVSPAKPGTAITKLRRLLDSAVSGATRQAMSATTRQTAESAPVSVGSGQNGFVQVDCPAPLQAFNGGESNDGSMVRLILNYPEIGTSAGSSVWRVGVHNEDSTAKTFRAYADCIDATIVPYVRAYHLNINAPAGSQGVDDLTCPSGYPQDLGGGYALSILASTDVAIDRSVTSAGNHGWQVHWYNYGSSPARISTYVTCTRGIESNATAARASQSNQGYQPVVADCAGTSKDVLAGGWYTYISSPNPEKKYAIITDSYPTSISEAIWGRPYNGPQFSATVICGKLP